MLASELTELGAAEVKTQRRAVAFSGDLQMLYRANIHCRTALSILRQLHQFSFDNKDSFYEQMRQIDWSSHFEKEKTISVIPVAHNNEVFVNTLYLAQLSKDAIVDHFQEKYGSRPDVDVSEANVRISVHVLNKQCSVSLDSSGEALFKRGYRRSSGPAPINEILAAGLIMLADWDKLSPFVDPMCGSGTFSIEAAMMSANIAPAARRKNFGFMHWPDFEVALFEQEQQEARSREQKVQAEILASDIKGPMLDYTRQNIMNAELMGSIKVQRNDFFRFKPPYEKGFVILNPPYGKRMSHYDLKTLNHDIGEALKHRFTGFRAGIISHEIEAMRHIGLRPTKKIPVFNGPLPCNFNVYDLFAGKLSEKSEKGEEWKGKRDRRRRTEDRGQRSEDRGRRSEDRGRMSEDRGRRSEDRGRRSEDRGRRSEDRGQRSEDRGRRTEDRGRRTEDRGRRTEDRSRRTDDRGRMSEDRGRKS